MVKFLVVIAVLALTVAAFAQPFPALVDAVQVQPIDCPDGEFTVKALIPGPDGEAFMFFGRVNTKSGTPVAVAPYVWMKYDPAGQLVKVYVGEVDGKVRETTREELVAKFPTPCALRGTGV